MQLQPMPRQNHTLRVSARQITSSAMLHFSSDELEHAVTREQIENPALEVREQQVCLYCGAFMRGTQCLFCRSFSLPGEAAVSTREVGNGDESQFPSYDIDGYGWRENGEDEEFDPLAYISTDQTLQEVLQRQLEVLIPPEDAPIAEQLVGNLNERGYLEISLLEIAEDLDVSPERVASVLSQLQTLEPLGIGARDLRECLLLQLRALQELGEAQELATLLIERYLERLGKSQFQEIARELKLPEQEVRQAAQYIRSMLNPYPAHSYNSDINSGRTSTAYMRPDAIIRLGESGYEVELIEEKRYRLRLRPGYDSQPLYRTADQVPAVEMQRYAHHQADLARFFIDCVHRRWRTLKLVIELVVDYQRDFLEKGVRYLHPLTRVEVASRLKLDEGTVSRAIANKYVLLPNGRLMSISDFFDGSLGAKDIMRELISVEAPRSRFSDDDLARILTARGIHMARRTVTKYREEMGIPSSRER